MPIEVQMPQMGESVVEGTIAKWLVKEGDTVSEDQALVEISTDKVDTEIPSPSAGRIAKLVAEEGQTLPVGAVIAVIDNSAGVEAQKAKPSAPPPERAQATPPQAATAAPASARRDQARAPMATEPAPAAVAADAPAAASPPEVRLPREEGGGENRRYSPVVVRMAAEHGLDIARIPGTGIGGRVSKRDVLKYLESLREGGATAAAQAPAPSAAASHVNGATAARPAPDASRPPPSVPPAVQLTGGYHPPVYQPREGDNVEPFTRRRKLIAEHMVYSKTHSPHVGTLAEVDLTKVTRLREAHKKTFQEREGFALTMLPLAAAATIRALKEFPRMNSSVAGDSLIIRKQINLGIAMDSDEGLLVPVIKAAEGRSVVGLAREIERLRRNVQEKKITPDDLSGGSFTLSNPGREGNLYGFAIINQPQVGILRMGEVKKRPIVIEVDGADALAIRTMMYLALSYDHRVVDGVLGNSFLYRTARIMEEADFEL
jgi:pyruvate/2-oxoglutarate dehydrogenase complex dihydrolipoamide acyltransferase (E2) component